MIKLKSIVLSPDWLPKLVNFSFSGIAFLLVAVSLSMPWYALPYVNEGADELATRDSVYSIYFKIAIVVVTLLFACAYVVRRQKVEYRGAMLLRCGVCCLILLLWFPAWVMLRDVEVSGDGAWLQQQHDTITWLGGDVYRAHAERSVELGTGVNAQDPPERLAVYRPPSGSLGLQRINDWLWWLGYGPAFTQFVGKGWFFAVGGYALGCICLCGFYWRRSVSIARYIFRQLVICILFLGSVVGGVSAVAVASAKSAIANAIDATAAGDYEKARHDLRVAIAWMPSLECDSGVIRQLGYFDAQLEEDSDYAALYKVFWFEQEGYYDRARKLVVEIAARKSEMKRVCARELSRHQLRIAINYINSGRYTQAGEYLDRLLDDEKNCLQACFHRQLIALQTDDVVMNRRMHKKLDILYRGIKSKNRRGVQAASWWMLAQGELDAGNVRRAWEARKKSKGQ